MREAVGESDGLASCLTKRHAAVDSSTSS